MDTIIVTDLECRTIIKGVNDLYSSHRTLMTIATKKSGYKDNLMWHGYKHNYIPELKEHHFVRLLPSNR